MNLIRIGVNFSHKKGEFCHKAKFPYYTICCFFTPFLYFYNGKLVKGESGDVIINTPNQIVYHGPCDDSNVGFVNDWMHVEGNNIGELLKKYPLPLNTAFNVGEGLFLRKYFNRLISEYKSEMEGSSDMIKSIITQMIIATHRAYNKQNFQDDSFYEIVAVRSAVMKNPEKDWSLEKMSKMSGYCVSRFSELYRKLYNTSPINDVIAHRISLAKTLLLSGQASVSYIATACGFNTINYFSKSFKASTGYTPSEFIDAFREQYYDVRSKSKSVVFLVSSPTGKILAATPMGRFGESNELEGGLLFLLNNEAASFITGVVLPIDGGFSAYSGVQIMKDIKIYAFADEADSNIDGQIEAMKRIVEKIYIIYSYVNANCLQSDSALNNLQECS